MIKVWRLLAMAGTTYSLHNSQLVADEEGAKAEQNTGWNKLSDLHTFLVNSCHNDFNSDKQHLSECY